jgi:uncharacterized protein
MVLIDVNLLIHAINVDFPEHLKAKAWLENLLQGHDFVGLPWAVIVGFVRISTNSKAVAHPFSLDEALGLVSDWLALPSVVILHPTGEHQNRFAELCRGSGATGNLVTDAHLAALAVEHNCELASNNGDFSRFPGLRWYNPLAADQLQSGL